VPEDFGFLHDVVLQQGERLFIQAGFAVDMTIMLSPPSGPVGTPITVEVKGIGWRPLESSWMLLYDNNFTGWISAVTTAGSATFTIPASGRPGVHLLEVLHGEFTFPYRNMRQSPEGDRPRFALRFNLTPDAPVLPPPVEEQAQQSVRGLPAPGTLAVAPPFAGVGQPVTVNGASFAPGKRHALVWTTVVGNRVGGHGWNDPGPSPRSWRIHQGVSNSISPPPTTSAARTRSLSRMAPGSRREACGSSPPHFRWMSITARPARPSPCI
jgi:hypothetical protein